MLGHLVVDFRVVLQCEKSVGESLGDVQRMLVVLGQFESLPLPKSGRVAPQVDDYVENGSPSATYQLRFSMGWQLIMHAAQCCLPLIQRDIGLYQMRVETLLGKLPLAPGPGKETSLVFLPLRHDYFGIFKLSGKELHSSLSET